VSTSKIRTGVPRPLRPPVGPASPSAFRRALDHQVTIVSGILLLIVIAFSAWSTAGFATIDNFRNVTLDASVLLVLSVGTTFLIISGGIDLSIGSVLVFSSVISVKVMSAVGGNSWGTVVLGFVAALVAGGAWGLLNGVLIARAKLPAILVTLATLGMALGAAQLITHGIDLTAVPPKLSETIGTGRVAGLPWITVIALVVVIVAGTWLHFTRFGRYTYAIGSNPEAARRVGIHVDRHLAGLYTMMGILSGLAGFLSVARFSTTSLAGHNLDALNAITGTLLGGTSLFGGVGLMFGTVVGVFIPAVLQNGFVIVGVQSFWQEVAVGAVLIAAVYADRLRRPSAFSAGFSAR
jgi:ribose transport system permease protein